MRIQEIVKFRNKYFVDMSNTVIKIPNDIFEKLNESNIKGIRKTLAFVIYLTLKTFQDNDKLISNSDLKTLLNYENDSIYEVLKQLDAEGFTEPLKRGFKKIIYNEKTEKHKGYFVLSLNIVEFTLFKSDNIFKHGYPLAVYCFIQRHLLTRTDEDKNYISFSYIAKGLSLNEDTILNYAWLLNDYGFIKITKGIGKIVNSVRDDRHYYEISDNINFDLLLNNSKQNSNEPKEEQKQEHIPIKPMRSKNFMDM